ncbi:MAG: ABC transporter ATP-binding protein [Ktedonobacterales bacterium]|nr:ABC transporter ATP-binding protein [Ktedonobacterales bacterium]
MTNSTPAAAPVLDIRDLRVQFATRDGAVPAVVGLSLTVAAGEIVGLVGESGCGKSTTALATMRLLPPYARITGQIRVDDLDLVPLSEGEMRRIRGERVAMIFQDALAALDPTMTVGRQIMEPLTIHLGMSGNAAQQRAIELLDLVGIPSPASRMRQHPHEFSGGMRQRVMIATALACNPHLLLADEPTTALDVTVQRQILNLLLGLRAEMGAGIVLITHDVGVVGEICDRVVVMYAGREVESGPTEAVFTQPRHPYTHGLLGSTLDATQDRDTPLRAIPGLPPDLAHLPAGCVFAPRCPLATEVCRQQEPPLVQVAPGQQSACWHWQEVAA